MPDKISLTEERIRNIQPPKSGEYVLWDSKVSGFGVRCFPSGRKVYILMYRADGGGRRARRRRMKLGEVGKIGLANARSAAQEYLGAVARGGDPQAERKAKSNRVAARLDKALAAYGEHLKKRHVVNREQIIRTLERGMPGPANSLDLAEIDRQAISARIAKLETKTRTTTKQTSSRSVSNVQRVVGGPGAAADFRAKANTFFNWAVNQGLIFANPLAGWRRERTTRAQLTSRKGRALTGSEIRKIWSACADLGSPYGDFVRLLLICGQRRTETARMKWGDLDLDQGWWSIPAGEAKNGRPHRVPLPPEAIELICAQGRHVGSPFVFPGRTSGSTISGWTGRQAELVKNCGVEFTLHDLRRTFRSGLKFLGQDTELAEMMLNHTRSELVETYDREPRWADKMDAAVSWATHVSGLATESAH